MSIGTWWRDRKRRQALRRAAEERNWSLQASMAPAPNLQDMAVGRVVDTLAEQNRLLMALLQSLVLGDDTTARMAAKTIARGGLADIERTMKGVESGEGLGSEEPEPPENPPPGGVTFHASL